MNPGKTQVCRFVLLLCLLCAASLSVAYAAPWFPFGPYGGDARAFAQDPQDHTHLYLGTTDGWLYQSHDGGATWSRLSRIGHRDDLVLDHILVDPVNPKHLVVGTWVFSRLDGGIYVSRDGGLTWTSVEEMGGQSIRSMTISPSDPSLMLAGSVQSGVYRSTDGGDHWELISPPGSKEIHEVESLAIDPSNPEVIYAGTWHLPWKTADGGKHWTSMKQGIIDDSDVFSIIVDPEKPSTVYVSACSGIYKSENTGASFVKVQGIPSEARRTRVLRQDPTNLKTVFAGTTEGLYRTQDAGANWQRMTDPTMIINDVYVDPGNPQHVLLATDRDGVMESDDGGLLFRHSNEGFSARQIVAFASDPHRQATMYAGVINDKQAGGVFKSTDGGLRWEQISDGLGGSDVLSLAAAPDGEMLAGTEHGIFRLADESWRPAGQMDSTAPASDAVETKPLSTKARTVKGRARPVAARRTAAKKAASGPETTDAIFAMTAVGDLMYAATSTSLLRSESSGISWEPVPAVPPGEWRFVAAAKSTVLAGQLKGMMLSQDNGTSWQSVEMPKGLTQIATLAVDNEGELWVGGGEGVYLSTDHGGSWHTVRDLNVNDIDSLFYDAANNRVLVTANNSTTHAFAVNVADKRLSEWDTGWNLRMLRPVEDHLLGVLVIGGVVLQPRMVDSPFVPAK